MVNLPANTKTSKREKLRRSVTETMSANNTLAYTLILLALVSCALAQDAVISTCQAGEYQASNASLFNHAVYSRATGEQIFSVALTSGNVVFAQRANNSLLVTKLNSYGEHIWSNTVANISASALSVNSNNEEVYMIGIFFFAKKLIFHTRCIHGFDFQQ